MISPTGFGVRGIDKHGSGAYNAGRGDKYRLHIGADYICEPGQIVYSPITGVIVRERKPYSGKWSGVQIRNSQITVTLFYINPNRHLITMPIKEGDAIGTAQDIAEKYPGIVPHVHMQIDSVNPELFINMP